MWYVSKWVETMVREQLLQQLEKEEKEGMERRLKDVNMKGNEDTGVASGF